MQRGKGIQGFKPLYKFSEIFLSARSQYLYYTNRFRGMVIFFQVGCFYEFYGEIKNEILKIMCLKRIKNSKRAVKYGFHVRLAGEYIKMLAENGLSVIIIRETNRYVGKIKERLPEIKIISNEKNYAA